MSRKLERDVRRLIDENAELRKDLALAAQEHRLAAAAWTKAAETQEKWMSSITKRVNKLEHWRTGLTAGGLVAAYFLRELWKKFAGLIHVGS